jgi:hypothetical protein
MTDLELIVDTLLPGDQTLSLPSASQTNFWRYLINQSLQTLCSDFVEMLETLCTEKFKISFVEMNSSQRLDAINACKVVNIKLFSEFTIHLMKAYYTCPIVLEKIGAGSTPPFPEGNVIDQNDWLVLEPVYERGKCYRDT